MRAREDARGDLMRARHRLSKLLLRHGMVIRRPRGRGRTTDGFAGTVPNGPLAIVSTSATAGCSREDHRSSRRLRRVVYGGGLLRVQLALTVEPATGTGSVPPRSPFLGLTPSENSSGERRRQGAITKAGNTHARRLLVEAAWHQRLERHARTHTHRQVARRASASRPQRPPLHRRLRSHERHDTDDTRLATAPDGPTRRLSQTPDGESCRRRRRLFVAA